LEDYAGAIEDYNKVIQQNPDQGEAYLNRGIAKEMIRDEAGACADWKKAQENGISIPSEYLIICNEN
jgi:Flp pilus assembly protein TadD